MGQIALHDVVKNFGDVKVVKGLSFTVEAGQFTTLLGPSGCGKSTTLNMIAGLEDITGGSITLDGQRVDDLPPNERDLAFVFQDYALYPHMTVFGNMAFGLKMRKLGKDEIRSRVEDAARRLAIDHLLDRKPRQLSGGQRQRVALGRAMARRPSVFLFDEPLSNLDALLRDQTRSEIKQLHQDLGATSVFVTHDQEEAMTLSDRIAVMSQGVLEQYGTPEQVYHRPATEFVATFVGKPRMNVHDAVREERGRYRIVHSDFTFDINVAGAPERIRLGVRAEDLTVHAASTDRGVRGVVALVEPLGAVTDISIAAGGTTLVARVPGLAETRVGDEVRVSGGTVLHAFDPESGRRLAVD